MTDSPQLSPGSEPGYVRPLEPDLGSADPFGVPSGGTEPQSMTPWTPEPAPDRRGIWIGAAVLGVVVVAAIAGVIWFRNLVGDPLGSARSVPPQAQMVVSLDALQLIDFDRFQRLVDAFADPAGTPGVVEEEANILDGLDRGFMEAFGVDFRDGVLSWVGRTATFALWDVGGADLTAGDVPEVMLAVEVRDAGKAEDFLDRVMDAAARETASVVEQTTIADERVLLVSDRSLGSEQTVYGTVAGDVMILTASDSALRDALVAHRGSSIVDSSRYTDAIAQLPADRLMTAYIDGGMFDDFMAAYEELFAVTGQQAPEVTDPGISAAAGSFSLVDEGLQFDAVTMYRNADQVVPMAASEPEMVGRLPAGTLGYLAFPFDSSGINQAIESLETTLGADYDQVAAELEAQIGIDIFGELLPSLDNGAVFAAYETREGLLSRQLGGLGLLAAVGLNDPAPVTDALHKLDELIEEQVAQDPSITFDLLGDLRVAGDGVDAIVAWGVAPDLVAVGSTVTEVEDMLSGGGGGVREASLYRELDAALPGEGLMFYLDMSGILDLVQPPPEVGQAMAPLLGAGASADVNGTVAVGRLLVAIDY